MLGPPGTGKSHVAQAIGRAVIQQGYCVLYREAHTLIEEIADATLDGTRKAYLAELAAVPLLIVDDLGMRKLPHTAAEDLLEVVMCRYERASTLLTSNRPVDDWSKLLGDTAPVTAPARSATASRTRAQMRATQLAHESPDRLAHRGADEVELHWSRPQRPWWPVLSCPPGAAAPASPAPARSSPAGALDGPAWGWVNAQLLTRQRNIKKIV